MTREILNCVGMQRDIDERGASLFGDFYATRGRVYPYDRRGYYCQLSRNLTCAAPKV